MRKSVLVLALAVIAAGVAGNAHANMAAPPPGGTVVLSDAHGDPEPPALHWAYYWDDFYRYSEPRPGAVLDQINRQVTAQFARNHHGRKLGAMHVGARADVAFTVNQKTKKIRVKASAGESDAFEKEAVTMVKNAWVSKTWPGNGPPEIEFHLTVFNGETPRPAGNATPNRAVSVRSNH